MAFSRRLELRLQATKGGCLKTSLQRLEECKMLKCLRRILEILEMFCLYVEGLVVLYFIP